MEYNFRKIEEHWQEEWKESNVYKVSNDSPKPKYYVLDMFPYPSGTGLHVGHPLGYIASDIFARYKRLKGFNVLHPMGYDAFGLPAEQYAIEHGIHPAVSTEQNIKNFRAQLDKIGFCFDWSREVNTSHPEYYKWTQWIFLKLFKSFYDRQTQKAESVTQLIETFEKEGNVNHRMPVSSFQLPVSSNQQLAKGNQFTAENWNSFDELTQQTILMEYRLAYCGYGEVNWCEVLGTVLANDEVVNGVSERGGYPVVKKKLRQWYLRITEYADRLLEGLQTVDFSEAMKEMQSNWIGKSYGAEISFELSASSHEQRSDSNLKSQSSQLIVYTTRPDTIFGVDFMVIAPEHELISSITTKEQQQAVDEYITYVKSRSDRERQAEKKITGCFTGAFAINPFNKKEIPIWISEYVLAGYGTGAIMAVPCGDERDLKFAKHFNIPVTNIIGKNFNGEEANATKDAILENSDFLNGVVMRDAIVIVNNKIEELGIGKKKVNYRMRDAAFSRQRYWGEPFPIIWTNGIAYPLNENELPLILPEVEKYGPGPDGEGPLANLKDWVKVPSPPTPLHGVEKGAAVASGIPKYKVVTPIQYELAKEMRKSHTEAEEKLWDVLRNENLGVKFRRQHPIEAYIVDFICLQEKLIVEVDGGYHENEEQKLYDENRTKILNDIGFEVIRFTNDEVLINTTAVKNKIKQHVASNKKSNTNATDTINYEDAHTPLHSWRGAGVRETNTMPGYAGSSWYFLRYMDPNNNNEFCSRKASNYWGQVDLYIGGTEHAVGHLLYSRMWTKALYDLNFIGHDEPYKKLVNQGMIQGVSEKIFLSAVSFRYLRDVKNQNSFHVPISEGYDVDVYDPKEDGQVASATDIIHQRRFKLEDFFIDNFSSNTIEYRADITDVDNHELNIASFINSHRGSQFKNAVFLCDGGFWFQGKFHRRNNGSDKFFTEPEVEKMSKSKYNVVSPDEIVEKYGADTFRMYEMFLGPVEQSKPWDTKGIEGVHRFLKKLWRSFYDEMKGKVWNEEKANDAELKILHKTIKKIEEDTERFSFNTAVSAAMIAVNEFSDLKCNKKEVLEPLLILLTPYAPHICEELWHLIGNTGTILDATYPKADEKYLKESTKNYPIAFNGRTRAELNISLDATQQQVEEMILSNESLKKWFEGKQPKKIIYVKNKMINVVI